ncbi:MAG TPA: DUF6036 family nucleotidyltransferase [Pyrinomonadaceae bacterium]|jgi:hypothetical protein|nr:DUF6036 family nucleotidyltransferase [Pyrinomonadaceae bacterium]
MNTGISMIETLRDFVAKMNELGIDYMVTGSFAMSAYGEIRMTRDIDVVIQIKEDRINPFTKLFEPGYYVSDESIRRAIANRSMFNVISHEHGGKIDCIVMKDTDFARASFQRRYKVSVAGVDFWTITKEDLIVAKLNWARETHSEMQIRDIANLTSSEYDAAYVDNWVGRLQLEFIWREVAEWKTRHKRPEN